MDNIRWGVIVGALVSGPTLWSLVSGGDLDAGTALVRWAAVVAVCTLGVAGLRRIVADYEAQAAADALAAEEALAASRAERVVLEGTPLPADVPPPPVTRPGL
ncbi:hypothetical protein [Kineosporia sp. A_224]|uniref:hypothetical protein n=1 Tax=Kineosporia sp. A_224 TaxID=1962180 RepID=UPI000B4A96F4|nr:hypothetical protein [Kineosporia sp. A_224]